MKATTTILFFLLSFFVQAQCDSLSFSLAVIQPGCNGYGSIAVTNLQGTAPFQITGAGSTLAAGTYNVQVKDACGNIRTRTATLAPYTFDFSWAYQTGYCGTVTFSFSNPALQYSFDGVNYTGLSQMTTNISAGNNIVLYAKDSCGNVITHTQFVNREYFGYIAALQMRIQCDKVDIFPVYYGFNAPSVCLYDFATKALVECKQAPANYSGGALTNFFDKDYARDYYVIVQDGCYRDSAYFGKKQSSGGSELNPYNWDCTTFTMHVDGMEDTVCLYNKTTNTLISCKGQDHTSINPRTGVPWPSGAVWENLPYGCYYAYIFDPCTDSTFKIDSCVHYPFAFSAALAGNCQINQSGIVAQFDPGAKGPFRIEIIYPNGAVALDATVSNAYSYNYYPTYPQEGTLTVLASDACRHTDTAHVYQPPIYPVRSVSVVGGCPGVSGSSGSGDIALTGNAQAYSSAPGRPAAIVSIISPSNIAASYHSASAAGEVYHFTNLPTGTYIIQSVVGCFGFAVYDTVTIKPYAYPRQYISLQSCNNGNFTFKDSVGGGVPSYSLEMASPLNAHITSPFMVMADSVTKIQIKATDACGNSNTYAFSISGADCKILAIGTPVTRTTIKDRPVIVYPNPSHGSFTVSFSKRIKSDYEIEIVSSVGNKVYDKKLFGIDQKNVGVDVAFATGAYMIRVKDLRSGDVETFKHVVL